MTTPENDPRETDRTSGDPVDHQPGDGGPALDADEGEPDVEPFAGDDDIRSGHYSLGADEQSGPG